ncbi:MAG: type II toxin-antitoxin system RelE/ParE family toxin [Deltaproteobacteria bacterium]|nr:type II toxin-antitoxin system RelE/ParE family toxin [Deltaproteobacteria bacterium]
MAYRVLLTRTAEKGLDALPRPLFLRVKRELLALAEDPYPVGCKAFKGRHKGLHRARLGDYRIICEVRGAELVIVVVKIGTRGGAYRE